MVDRGRTVIPSISLLLKLPVLLFELNQHDRVISSLVLVNTHTCVNERITDMMSAGPFVFLGIQFIFMAKRDFAINCYSSDHSS